MKFPAQFSTMHDPDGGGTGDPASEPDGGDPTPSRAAADNSQLKAVADTIRQAIEAARTPAPLAPAVPTGPSSADIQRALREEAGQINAQVDELFAAGKASEAMAIRDAFSAKVNGAMATNPNDNAIVRTAVALGERVARTEHKAIMDRWGDEVRRAVDSLPLEERVLPNAWDTAVNKVRSNHFQEIMEETVTTRVAEEKAKFVPPPSAPGSRGQRQLQGAAAKLSEEQVWGADLCGVEPEAYAKEVEREARYDAMPFKERAKFPGYPVLEDPRGNAVVAPGKF